MDKKRKLKGERKYIDNDLIWNKRRARDNVVKLAKYVRSQREHVKIGYNRVIGENQIWNRNKKYKIFFHRIEEEQDWDFLLEFCRSKKKREGGMGWDKESWYSRPDRNVGKERRED